MWLLDRRQFSSSRIRSDGEDNPRASTLVVKEDGKRLGPAHSLHADIAAAGGGRFSHWDSSVVFSTSDNSDPRENGRTTRPISACYPVPSLGYLRFSRSSDYSVFERRGMASLQLQLLPSTGQDLWYERFALPLSFSSSRGVSPASHRRGL